MLSFIDAHDIWTNTLRTMLPNTRSHSSVSLFLMESQRYTSWLLYCSQSPIFVFASPRGLPSPVLPSLLLDCSLLTEFLASFPVLRSSRCQKMKRSLENVGSPPHTSLHSGIPASEADILHLFFILVFGYQ